MDLCGICCPHRIEVPEDINGCVLPEGHESRHEFHTEEQIVRWETKLDCTCDDCLKSEGFADNCITYTVEDKP